MIRSEKKVILAWTFAQAKHFAQSMEWTRKEWDYLDPSDRCAKGIRGRHDIVLYDVRAPRYHASFVEKNNMQELWTTHITPALNAERIAKLNVVNLP